jgi:hypothetical protein
MKIIKFETMEAATEAMDHGDNPNWEDIANGEAVFELPDGSQWARVKPLGFTEYDQRYERFLIRHEENEHRRFINDHGRELITDEKAERLDRVLDQMNPSSMQERRASFSEAIPIHDIFVNITEFEPRRMFCVECHGEYKEGGWLDPTEDEPHPKEDDPFAEDHPPVIVPGTKTRQ